MLGVSSRVFCGANTTFHSRLFVRLVPYTKASFSATATPKQKSSSARNIALGLAAVTVVGTALYYQSANRQKETAASNKSYMEEGQVIKRMEALERELSEMKVGGKNKAFVFVKPHAVTPEVEALITKTFQEKKIRIVDSGSIDSVTIDQQFLIDAHYGAIASKAVKLSPAELNLGDRAKADFEKMAKLSWDDALTQGKVLNAKQFSEKYNIDAEALDTLWSKLKRGEQLIKFGGGFYCGELSDPTDSSNKIYVINGFYMAMRGKFTKPGAEIKYYLVEFLPELLSWSEFRNKVLGTTDPATAEKGSLRRAIYDNYKSLKLSFQPNTGDNSVHASASPFEAFCERVNWLRKRLDEEDFGKGLLRFGVEEEQVRALMEDPSVEFEGKKQSVFDLLEDLDGLDCFQKTVNIAKSSITA